MKMPWNALLPLAGCASERTNESMADPYRFFAGVHGHASPAGLVGQLGARA